MQEEENERNRLKEKTAKAYSKVMVTNQPQSQQQSQPYEEKKNRNMKAIDDININIFHDDNLKEMEFENIINDEKMFNKGNPSNHSGSEADWEYLKKTVHSKEGKILSDDFIRYHQITDQLVEDEDTIVNLHMTIIKEDAKLLTEEGDLITNIKAVGDESEFEMEEYALKLERIIDKKISLYTDLKGKIDVYKKHIKEEDEIRSRLNPKFFIEN